MRPIAVLPTLCTLGNLVSGFAAIHYASKPIEYQTGVWGWKGLTLAGVLIFVGMLFDAVDGAIARWTRSNSTIGAQLDSLCDMVTFGVAPAYMALRLVIIHVQGAEVQWIIGPEAESVYGKFVWGVAAVYVCCAALRLARFNVQSGLDPVNDHRFFRGLPSPGAAGTVASLIILHQHLWVNWFPATVPTAGFVRSTSFVIPGVMLLCAFAMVSSIPYVHFTNRYLSGARSFAYVARIVVILALAVWWLQESLAIVFTVYALSGPVGIVWRKMRTK